MLKELGIGNGTNKMLGIIQDSVPQPVCHMGYDAVEEHADIARTLDDIRFASMVVEFEFWTTAAISPVES